MRQVVWLGLLALMVPASAAALCALVDRQVATLEWASAEVDGVDSEDAIVANFVSAGEGGYLELQIDGVIVDFAPDGAP